MDTTKPTYLAAFDDDGSIRVWVYRDSVEIGSFSTMSDGVIMDVDVVEGERRKGIATQMLRIAQAIGHVEHSPDRSEDGDAWARSTGDELPEREWLTDAELIAQFGA